MAERIETFKAEHLDDCAHLLKITFNTELWNDKYRRKESRRIYVLPANLRKKRVDPTRLELVTSAMRGRLNAFAVDRGGLENRLSKPYY